MQTAVSSSACSILDLAAANWNTCLGAACFLACAVAMLLGKETEQPQAAAAPALPDGATSA
jgi:hypothetical protein